MAFKKLPWGSITDFNTSWPVLNFSTVRTDYSVFVKLNDFLISFCKGFFFKKSFTFNKSLTLSHLLIKYLNTPSYILNTGKQKIKKRKKLRKKRFLLKFLKRYSLKYKKRKLLNKFKTNLNKISTKTSLDKNVLVLVEIFLFQSSYDNLNFYINNNDEFYSLILKSLKENIKYIRNRSKQNKNNLKLLSTKNPLILKANALSHVQYWSLFYRRIMQKFKKRSLKLVFKKSYRKFASMAYYTRRDFKSRRKARPMSFIKRFALSVFKKFKKKKPKKFKKIKKDLFSHSFSVFNEFRSVFKHNSIANFMKISKSLKKSIVYKDKLKKAIKTPSFYQIDNSYGLLSLLFGLSEPKSDLDDRFNSNLGFSCLRLSSNQLIFRKRRADDFEFEFRNLSIDFEKPDFNFNILLKYVYFVKYLKNLRWQSLSKRLKIGFKKFGLNILFSFRLINFTGGNANFFGNYLLKQIRFSRNPNLNRIIKPFLKTLISEGFSENLNGIKIKIKGRFKRSQRAMKVSFGFGVVSLGSIHKPKDYSNLAFTGKLGTSSLKVFLHYAS